MSDCPKCGNPQPQPRCHVCGYLETAEEKRTTETAEAPRAKRKS